MNGRKPLEILITGLCAPPNSGGVAVYVRRLFERLKMQGHNCLVYDQFDRSGDGDPEGIYRMKSKWSLYWRIFQSGRYDIMHINENTWKQRCALVMLARLKGMQPVITIHSFRDDYRSMSILNRLAMRWTLKNAACLVASGMNEAERLRELEPVIRIRKITPFIPPLATDGQTGLPDAMLEFCRRHSYTLCANGSNMNFYEGKDIYGLDMLVEACGILRTEWDIGFIYCLTRITNAEYFGSIQERISQLGIEDHFLINTNDIEFWKVIDQCDIFARPSRTDSFGISVAESIYLKKPAIASDVCLRPEGTTVFTAGNVDRMTEAISAVLARMTSSTWDFNPDQPENGSILLESLYYELVEGSARPGK